MNVDGTALICKHIDAFLTVLHQILLKTRILAIASQFFRIVLETSDTDLILRDFVGFARV